MLHCLLLGHTTHIRVTYHQSRWQYRKVEGLSWKHCKYFVYRQQCRKKKSCNAECMLKDRGDTGRLEKIIYSSTAY